MRKEERSTEDVVHRTRAKQAATGTIAHAHVGEGWGFALGHGVFVSAGGEVWQDADVVAEAVEFLVAETA